MTETTKPLPPGTAALLHRAARLIDPGPRPAWLDDETLPAPTVEEANE